MSVTDTQYHPQANTDQTSSNPSAVPQPQPTVQPSYQPQPQPMPQANPLIHTPPTLQQPLPNSQNSGPMTFDPTQDPIKDNKSHSKLLMIIALVFGFMLIALAAFFFISNRSSSSVDITDTPSTTKKAQPKTPAEQNPSIPAKAVKQELLDPQFTTSLVTTGDQTSIVFTPSASSPDLNSFAIHLVVPAGTFTTGVNPVIDPQLAQDNWQFPIAKIQDLEDGQHVKIAGIRISQDPFVLSKTTTFANIAAPSTGLTAQDIKVVEEESRSLDKQALPHRIIVGQ